MTYPKSFGQRIAVLGRLFAKHLNEQIIPTGITSSQWSIIICLSRHPSLTQVEICNQLSLEPPTVSKTLCTLETDGWIDRITDPNDKRGKRILLTDKAMDQLAAWSEIAGAINQKALSGLNSNDIATFDRILDSLMSNMKAPD